MHSAVQSFCCYRTPRVFSYDFVSTDILSGCRARELRRGYALAAELHGVARRGHHLRWRRARAYPSNVARRAIGLLQVALSRPPLSSCFVLVPDMHLSLLHEPVARCVVGGRGLSPRLVK